MTMTGQEVSTRAKVEATYDTYLFSRIIAKEASLTLDQRFDAVLRNPDVMTLATLVDPSNHSGNGRTSAYPNYVWLFIGGLVGSRGSQRAVADWIRVPKNWFHFIDTICDAHGQHHRSNISSQPPSRTTIRHHNKRLIKAATTLTAVAHQLWIKQAQQQGCLNPNAGDTLREPARGNTVHGDGTVVKSPVRERKPHEKSPGQLQPPRSTNAVKTKATPSSESNTSPSPPAGPKTNTTASSSASNVNTATKKQNKVSP